MNGRQIVVALECYVRKVEDGVTKYLMLRRGDTQRFMPGVWMAPGGKMEHGEGLFECARREILEETGLTIKNFHLWAIGVSKVYDPGDELHFYFVSADLADGEIRAEDGVGDLHWLTAEEILKLDNLLAELPHLLPHLFENRPGVISCKSAYDQGNHMTHFEIESID